MKPYAGMTGEELLPLRQDLKVQHRELQAKDLKLDMFGGRPCVEQLDPSIGMTDVLSSISDLTHEDGTDYRNYSVFVGIDETKILLADMIEINPPTIIIYGDFSLNVMCDIVSRAMTHGTIGCTLWCKLDKTKSLCPVPGYDRRFATTEYFGIEMTNVSMSEGGSDMDMAEELVASDGSVKGVWCVPRYSDPQGYSYSDETVRRSARLKPATSDLRIFWDNAYDVHHLYNHDQDHLIEVLAECKRAGNPDLVYKFASTSKISFPGSGIAAIATSRSNPENIRAQLRNQAIGHDKVSQLRHARFFKDIHGMVEHIGKHANIIQPKFETVEEILDRELGGLGIGQWTESRGGCFISFDSLGGCTKDIMARYKKAGVAITSAGATYSYGKDPYGSNIRTAPTHLTLGNLIMVAELFTLCVRLSFVEKLLKTMTQLEHRRPPRKVIRVQKQVLHQIMIGSGTSKADMRAPFLIVPYIQATGDPGQV